MKFQTKILNSKLIVAFFMLYHSNYLLMATSLIRAFLVFSKCTYLDQRNNDSIGIKNVQPALYDYMKRIERTIRTSIHHYENVFTERQLSSCSLCQISELLMPERTFLFALF